MNRPSILALPFVLAALAGSAQAQNYFGGQGQPSQIDRELFRPPFTEKRTYQPPVDQNVKFVECSKNMTTKNVVSELTSFPDYKVLEFYPRTKNGEWSDGSCAVVPKRLLR